MTDTEVESPVAVRRFVSSATATPAVTESVSPLEQSPRLLSRRAAWTAGGFGFATVACLVLALGVTGGDTPPSLALQQEQIALQEAISAAESSQAALPTTADAQRGLKVALESAHEVAALQNQYRYLTGELISTGALNTEKATLIRQRLSPLFATQISIDELGPWYLLEADKHVPLGTGLPQSFDSGFVWVPQVPMEFTADGRIPVIWVAVQTRSAEGATPAVLAWATAEFDPQRKVFTAIDVGVTVTGASLGVEVPKW